MDKPIPLWLELLTAFALVFISFLIYLWLKNINIKDK